MLSLTKDSAFARRPSDGESFYVARAAGPIPTESGEASESHYWSNRAYDDYDALEQAAVHAWKKVALDNELMKIV
jgi:hypothetical protein